MSNLAVMVLGVAFFAAICVVQTSRDGAQKEAMRLCMERYQDMAQVRECMKVLTP